MGEEGGWGEGEGHPPPSSSCGEAEGGRGEGEGHPPPSPPLVGEEGGWGEGEGDQPNYVTSLDDICRRSSAKSKIATSAGLIPANRPAWPNVAGRKRIKTCRASLRKPGNEA